MLLRNGGVIMGRPLKVNKTWYKVYIKELSTPNIAKIDADRLAEYCFCKSRTGASAMEYVNKYAINTQQKYRAFHFHEVKGGETIDEKKILWTQKDARS